MIDQAGNAQILIADNRLVGIEYLADFQSHLCFLERTGQFLDTGHNGTNTHVHAGVELAAQSICNGTGKLFQILGVHSTLDLLDQNNIRFGNGKDKVFILIRKQILNDIVCRNVICRYNAYQQHYAADFRVEVQFTCLNDDVPQQYVVQYYILDEVVAIVLFIVVLLDIEQGNCQNIGILRSSVVHALYKDRILRLCTRTKRLIGITVADKNIMYITEVEGNELIGRSHLCQVAASDDGRGVIDNANGCVNGIPHLVNQSLK